MEKANGKFYSNERESKLTDHFIAAIQSVRENDEGIRSVLPKGDFSEEKTTGECFIVIATQTGLL